MADTYFVLPASHRLFVVFDHPGEETAALGDVEAEGLAPTDDAWIFSGEEGLASLDPGVGRHGVAVGIVRVIQRMLTSDCDYCDGLARALRAGGVVMALKVDQGAVENVSEVLRRHGGHSLAYGAHWSFVPLPHAARTPGAT